MIKYLTVIALMQPNKKPVPQQIIWDTGKIYEIDKVLDERKRASTKGGGAGIRYLVKINNHERYLFLKDYNWFIEE